MNYVTGTTTFQIESPSAVSLGKFDGLETFVSLEKRRINARYLYF